MLLAVSLFSAGAAARDVITGFCYTERIERPVAGALVALYGPDNILSGSTYSTNTGAFTLAAPDGSGKYYLVATSGSRTTRTDLGFDPKKPTPAIHVIFREPVKSVWQCLNYVWTKLDYVITTLIGFGAGIATKRWDNKRALRISLGRLAVAQAAVMVQYENLNLLLDEWLNTAPGAPRRGELRQQWPDVIATLKRSLEEFDAARPDAAVLFPLRGAEGQQQLINLKTATEQIRGLLGEQLDAFGNLSNAARQVKLRPFQDLRANPLVNG